MPRDVHHLLLLECAREVANKVGGIYTVIKTKAPVSVKSLYGRWLVEDSPRVLLFDTGSMYQRLDEATFGTSPPNDHGTNEMIVFGYLVAWFLGDASLAIPLCRKRHIDVTTVFTTHAMLLAGKRGIYHRYCIERSAAHCADVFTTVSHITAYEAENLLKRKPDGVVPSGLNVRKWTAMHEVSRFFGEVMSRCCLAFLSLSLVSLLLRRTFVQNASALPWLQRLSLRRR
ncbi:glycogen synthase-domain-containing protein [Mycena floridula]|nr:glycogen synthase-domain-containing protein [Mycena floridula]